jgi:hypothetical protein
MNASDKTFKLYSYENKKKCSVEVFQYFMLEDTVLWDVTLHSVAAW